MLRSDYDILVNVHALLKDSDLTEEDVSFLMGKDNGYFFGIFDPTEKSAFKEEFIPLFVPIFQTNLDNILPKKYYASEEVKITATTKFNKKSTVYRHTVTYADGSVSEKIEWKKKVVQGERKTENRLLTDYLMRLVTEDYFGTPRTSLFLLIHLQEHFKDPFTVTDIRVSLGKLIRKQGDKQPLLQRINDKARYFYSES